MNVEIVSATRLAADAFGESPLGMSLQRIEKDPRLRPHVAFVNSRGLPEVYNDRIDAENDDDVVVFVHDDVWLDDFYFTDRVIEGLQQFDVVGVAGNTRRQPRQETWGFGPGAQRLDLPHLRGAIAHGSEPLGKVGFYGPIVGACELLDGVFIAASRKALRAHGVRFDPRFAFHFYDLDFCRSARAEGLKLGTWPIAVTHRSTGNPGTPEWRNARDAYFAKWGD
jgi:GT2 family glycosyltransferase